MCVSVKSSPIKPHRQALVDDRDRPLSWEESPAPPSMPRGLTLTVYNELLRLLPASFKRGPAAQWNNHMKQYLQHLSQVSGIMDRRPVFVFGKSSCRMASFAPAHGRIRRTAIITPACLGFYCRRCYPGHDHHRDGRVDASITDTLPAELQCHMAAEHGGRESGRQFFVAGECYNRGLQHFVVKSGGLPCDALASHFFDVIRNKVDGRFKCRAAVSQIQYAGMLRNVHQHR